jgi:Putative bacterial sensory transduction regulator
MPPVAAVDEIETYLSELPALRARRLAHAEWGITVPADELDGEPLDVGLRIADGLLRAQAVALHGAGDLDPWMLLWWNRQTRLVRFACTRSRDVWVHADVPASGLDARGVDRLLGLIVEGALAVRGLRQPADAG